MIRDGVAGGDTLIESVARTDRYFPPLFHEMVSIGEQTGQLAEAFRRLADYYENRLQLRRIFLSGITWPLVQLAIVIFVVGVLIWVVGVIADSKGGKPVDLIGLGLTGERGLVIYMLFVVGAMLAATVVIRAVARGALWTRGLQRFVLRIPVFGKCVETMALAQLSWSLHLLLSVELDMRRLIPMALRSTRNAYYTGHADQIVADVVAGSELHEALLASGAFPIAFVDTVQVGEESGRLAESMGHAAQQYQELARHQLRAATIAAGYCIWGLVAMLIIFLIFRIASFYLGAIDDALNM